MSPFAGLWKPKSFVSAACCGLTQVSARWGVPCAGLPQAGLPGARGGGMRDGTQRFSCKAEGFALKTPVLKNVRFTNKHLGGLVHLQVRTRANLKSCHVLILSSSLSAACYTRRSAEKGQACLPRHASDLRRHDKRVGEQHCCSH